MNRTMLALLAAVTAIAALDAPARAQALEKFQFRLNWTLYGEHAPFFVALDKGFYKEEGLDVEVLEGSGSTTVAQLVANMTNPIAYVDAATMMRGVGRWSKHGNVLAGRSHRRRLTTRSCLKGSHRKRRNISNPQRLPHWPPRQRKTALQLVSTNCSRRGLKTSCSSPFIAGSLLQSARRER